MTGKCFAPLTTPKSYNTPLGPLWEAGLTSVAWPMSSPTCLHSETDAEIEKQAEDLTGLQTCSVA